MDLYSHSPFLSPPVKECIVKGKQTNCSEHGLKNNNNNKTTNKTKQTNKNPANKKLTR